MPVVRPDHASAPVVDDDGDVRVALPAAGLVHTDRVQPVEHARHRGLQPAATRLAMSPAVLHAICRKPLTVLWPATVISHAHPDPKSRVNRPPGPAHGTRETTTPCGRHSTRGTGPESPTRKQPKSRCRQLRPPPPLSYPGAFRPQREQRNAPFPHLTRATRTGASRSGESSNDTSSTIMSLTFGNRLNMLFN